MRTRWKVQEDVQQLEVEVVVFSARATSTSSSLPWPVLVVLGPSKGDTSRALTDQC